MRAAANPLTTPVTNYYHYDMLGTTRLMSNPSGASIEPAIFTAFGEPISMPNVTDLTRYGFVGAWEYQAHEGVPYLHLGARYYDPSSGRFLQRDPIGINGGINVFEYVESSPTTLIDPSGEIPWPNRGWIRYGPSRPRGAPTSGRRLAFRYGTHNPHIWGWRGGAIFGGLTAGSATAGYLAGRGIDNLFGYWNNGYRISDGLADWLFCSRHGSNYDPWGQ